MQTIVFLNVQSCCVSFILSVIYKPYMLSVVMLSVIMLNVIMLSVVMLNVVAPRNATYVVQKNNCSIQTKEGIKVHLHIRFQRPISY